MNKVRRFLGPSRKEVWQELARQINARYVEGGFWKGDKVEVDHGDWIVTLDSYAVSTGKTTVVYTRMRAPFVNPGGFHFTLYRRGLFSGLGKALGMQDIEIGDPMFDHDFIIKSNSDSRVRALLANIRVRQLIAAQPAIHFGVKDDEGWFGARFPDGVDELHFHVVGIIKDLQRLEQLFELFAETLDELCRMGAALDVKPGVDFT